MSNIDSVQERVTKRIEWNDRLHYVCRWKLERGVVLRHNSCDSQYLVLGIICHETDQCKVCIPLPLHKNSTNSSCVFWCSNFEFLNISSLGDSPYFPSIKKFF